MGQIATGDGCNNIEELICSSGIPSMSKPTLIEIERLLGSFLSLFRQAYAASYRRRETNSNKNYKYHQNVPSITVFVNGGWSTRSHKHLYNANLGVGLIFGAATKSCYIWASKINTLQ